MEEVRKTEDLGHSLPTLYRSRVGVALGGVSDVIL